MQLTFRIDDNNYLTFDLQLQASGPAGYQDGPELIAAAVSDSKLSQLEHDAVLDIAGQVVDYFSRDQQSTSPGPDWFEKEWLPATRVGGKATD